MGTFYPNSVWDGDSGSRNSDCGNRSSPDYKDWTRMLAEIQAVQQKVLSDIALGIGETEVVDGLAVHETGNSALHRTVLILDDVVLNITDSGANGGHGYVKLYVHPVSHVILLSGHMVATSIAAGSGGIANNAVLDIGVGTTQVATDNAVLATTEQNIAPKADVTLTGGTSTANSIQTTTQQFDGTGTPIQVFLNIAVEDASISADDTITISGRVTLLWSNCNCPT